MKNIFLNGLNNIAPTELNKSIIQSFYYDFAPTEQKLDLENPIDQLVYKLYELTEEEIKIVEGK
jgi:hypothetical protein